MKKSVVYVLLSLLCMGQVFAKEARYGGFCFELDYDGNATVTGLCEEGMTDAVIPSTFIFEGRSYVTTKIGKEAFDPYVDVGGVTVIIHVETVVIPNSVVSIGDNAFRFQNLTSVDIPSSVKTIGRGAFAVCRNLESVRLPGGLTEIPTDMFSGCLNLQTVSMPSSLKSIGSDAFHGCESLSSIVIPEGVTDIGNDAFWGCRKLQSVTMMPSTPPFGVYGFPLQELTFYLSSCEAVQAYSTQDWIYSRYLFNVSGEQSHTITLETNVGELGVAEILQRPTSCNGHEAVISATAVPFCEFAGWSDGNTDNPRTLTLDGDKTLTAQFVLLTPQIGGLRYKLDDSTHTAEVVRTLTWDDYSRSYYMRSYISGSVEIPSEISHEGVTYSVTSIGEEAFYYCDVDSVIIPASVTSIGKGAFRSSDLKYVTIPPGITSIPEDAFYRTQLEEVSIPASVTEIGDEAFSSCVELKSITIESQTPPLLGKSVFYKVPAELVTLPSCKEVQTFSDDPSWQAYGFQYAVTGTKIHNVSLETSDEELGNVQILQYPTSCNGQEAIISASPKTDCWFMGWSDGNTDTLRTIVVEGDTALTAQFLALVVSVDSVWYRFDPETRTAAVTYDPLIDSYEKRAKALQEKVEDEHYTHPRGSAYDGVDEIESKCIEYGLESIWKSGPFVVEIPDSLFFNGSWYAVTSIGNRAFERASRLQSVTIPDGVTQIGSEAFYYCNSLVSVSLPKGLKEIGSEVFALCGELKTISIPDGVTKMGDSLFQHCKALETVHFPSAFLEIPSNTFDGCSSLESINIPDGVTQIGSEAFLKCVRLKNVTLPDGVERIGYAAFALCDSLEAVVLSSALSEIGAYAFCGCDRLKGIVIPEKVTSIGSYAFYKSGTMDSVFTITVEPETPPALGEDAFSELPTKTINVLSCAAMEAYSKAEGWKELLPIVEQEYDLTLLSNDVHGEWCSVEVVQLPSKCNGQEAVISAVPGYGCRFVKWSDGSTDALHTITLNSDTVLTALFLLPTDSVDGLWYDFDHTSYTADVATNPYINRDGYEHTTIVVPDSVSYNGRSYAVTGIASYAFSYSDSLKSVIIPDGVLSIGLSAFLCCGSLESVTIPERVTKINFDTFSECTSLKSVTIPDGVTEIGEMAFMGCRSLEEILLPNGITEIGKEAFMGCRSLEGILLPDGITEIGEGVFKGCRSLKSVTIPDGVTKIGDEAFYECSSLESVVLSDKLTEIEWWAFSRCPQLTTITSRADTPPTVGWSPFGDAPVDRVYVPLNAVDLYKFHWSGYNIVGLEELQYHVTAQVDDLWYNFDLRRRTAEVTCAPLRGGSLGQASVVVPDSVDYEGVSYAVTSIGDDVFRNRADLLSVTLPDGLSSIGANAFFRCTGLKSVTIPEGVRHIGANAFYGCSALGSVVVESETPPALGTDAFANTATEAINVRSCGIAEVYAGSDGWEEFDVTGERLYAFSLSSNNDNWGRVKILQSPSVCNGNEAVVEAKAEEGKLFLGWSDGGKENPRRITLFSDRNLTAIFSDTETAVVVCVLGGDIVIYSPHLGETQVCHMDGRIARPSVQYGEGETRISGLPAGVYIVAGQKVFLTK